MSVTFTLEFQPTGRYEVLSNGIHIGWFSSYEEAEGTAELVNYPTIKAESRHSDENEVQMTNLNAHFFLGVLGVDQNLVGSIHPLELLGRLPDGGSYVKKMRILAEQAKAAGVMITWG